MQRGVSFHRHRERLAQRTLFRLGSVDGNGDRLLLLRCDLVVVVVEEAAAGGASHLNGDRRRAVVEDLELPHGACSLADHTVVGDQGSDLQ